MPESVTVVRAARLLDVVRGTIVRPGVLVVQGDRILRVGGRDVPAGATSIDLGDVTLAPRAHRRAHPPHRASSSGDWFAAPVRETAADAALRACCNAGRTLRAGFTTVRDVGAGGFSDVALMRAIDAGRVDGPADRARRATPSASPAATATRPGGRPGVLERGWKDGVADGVDEVIKAVRYQIKHGAKVIKVCATAGVLSFEGPVGAQQLTIEELRAIVGEARRHGLRVAAHAHGDRRDHGRGPGRRGLHRARLHPDDAGRSR